MYLVNPNRSFAIILRDMSEKHEKNHVAYWTYGNSSNPPILAIHGFRGTHHGLEKLIAPLLDLYYVIIPDLPGFGESPAYTDRTHTIQNYSRTVEQLSDSLHLKQPVLLGHSMGSIIASDLVSRLPQFTNRIILVNPVAEAPSKLLLLPGYVYHYAAGKYLPKNIGEKILRNKFLFLVGSATMTKTRDKELRKEIHQNHKTYMQRFSDRRSLMEAFGASNTTSVSNYIDHIHTPTLLIAGKKDAIAPIKGQRSLASRNKKVHLVELDNVGHIIHYEKPTEAAAAIREFLN